MKKLAILLLLGDVGVIVLHFWLGNKSGFFNVDSEQNLISLYMGVKLMFSGGAVGVYLWLWQKLNRSWREVWLWIPTGLVFLWIGLDDMMALHERITFGLNKIFSTGGFYADSFNWLWYFLPFVGLVIYIYGRLIYNLWNSKKGIAVWAMIGVLLWVVSFIIEWWGRSLLIRVTVPVDLYHAFIIIEESLELLGATIWVIVLVWHMRLFINKHVRVEWLW